MTAGLQLALADAARAALTSAVSVDAVILALMLLRLKHRVCWTNIRTSLPMSPAAKRVMPPALGDQPSLRIVPSGRALDVLPAPTVCRCNLLRRRWNDQYHREAPAVWVERARGEAPGNAYGIEVDESSNATASEPRQRRRARTYTEHSAALPRCAPTNGPSPKGYCSGALSANGEVLATITVLVAR